jgi:hypothetical protein
MVQCVGFLGASHVPLPINGLIHSTCSCAHGPAVWVGVAHVCSVLHLPQLEFSGRHLRCPHCQPRLLCHLGTDQALSSCGLYEKGQFQLPPTVLVS